MQNVIEPPKSGGLYCGAANARINVPCTIQDWERRTCGIGTIEVVHCFHSERLVDYPSIIPCNVNLIQSRSHGGWKGTWDCESGSVPLARESDTLVPRS